MDAQQAGDLLFRPQALGLRVTFQPLLGDRLERVGPGVECRQAGAHAADGFAGALARLPDRHHVDGTDGDPNLLAVRVAGDDDEHLGPGGLDADVMAAQLRVGKGTALRARLERGHAFVGQGLAHGKTGPANRWLTTRRVRDG